MSFTSRERAKEAVDKGVQFLDEKYGPDEWRKRMDWDNIDVSSHTLCPGGQLEGRFRAFIDKHMSDLSVGWDSCAMGFAVMNGVSSSDINAEWKSRKPVYDTPSTYKARTLKGYEDSLREIQETLADWGYRPDGTVQKAIYAALKEIAAQTNIYAIESFRGE